MTSEPATYPNARDDGTDHTKLNELRRPRRTTLGAVDGWRVVTYGPVPMPASEGEQPITRHRRLVQSLLALACLAAALPGTSAMAATTRTCSPPKYPGDGYFSSLKVKGTTCATGKKLAVNYYKCRLRNGGRKGRCKTRVLDYRCTERRNAISTEFVGRVTCKRGSRTITHAYQQNT